MTETKATYNAGYTPPISACPYCGSSNVSLGQFAVVRCADCGATGPSGCTDADAVLLWNTATDAINKYHGERDEARSWARKYRSENLRMREALAGVREMAADVMQLVDEGMQEAK